MYINIGITPKNAGKMKKCKKCQKKFAKYLQVKKKSLPLHPHLRKRSLNNESERPARVARMKLKTKAEHSFEPQKAVLKENAKKMQKFLKKYLVVSKKGFTFAPTHVKEMQNGRKTEKQRQGVRFFFKRFFELLVKI